MGLYRRPFVQAQRLRQVRRGRWVGTVAAAPPAATYALPVRRRATAMGAANAAFHRQQQYNRVLRGRRLQQGRWVGTVTAAPTPDALPPLPNNRPARLAASAVFHKHYSRAVHLHQLRHNQWVGTKPYIPSVTPPLPARRTARVAASASYHKRYVRAVHIQQLHRARWVATKPYIPSLPLPPPVVAAPRRLAASATYRKRYVRAVQLQQLHRKRWVGTKPYIPSIVPLPPPITPPRKLATTATYRKRYSRALQLQQLHRARWIGTKPYIPSLTPPLPANRTARVTASATYHKRYHRALQLRQLRHGLWIGTKPYIPSLTPPVPARKTRVSTRTSPFRKPFSRALQLLQQRRNRWIGTLAPAGGAYQVVVLADTPYSYFRMGQPSGTEPDESGSARVLTVSGATRDVTGALTTGDDGAISFDGIDDYASVPLDLSDTDELSVEFWLKWDNNDEDDDFAMEFTSSANSNSGSFNLDYNLSGDTGNVSIKTFLEPGDALRWTVAQPSAATWHHWVLVFNQGLHPAASTLTVYIDGVSVTVSPTGNADHVYGNFANDTLYVMSRNGSALFGAGDMDELAIYKYLLSPEQVAAHYDARDDYAGTDVTAPTPTVTSVDVTKISRISGKDVATIVITTDEYYVEYELRVVANGAAGRGTGTQIETSTVTSRNTDTLTITDDEFVAASASEGTNVVKLFVKDAAGNWSS